MLLCAAAMAAASGARFTLDDADVYKLVAASRKAPLISTRSLYVDAVQYLWGDAVRVDSFYTAAEAQRNLGMI